MIRPSGRGGKRGGGGGGGGGGGFRKVDMQMDIAIQARRRIIR